ncbi:MAG: serine hydrolase domain-containing protein [Anaerolineales bacterium]
MMKTQIQSLILVPVLLFSFLLPTPADFAAIDSYAAAQAEAANIPGLAIGIVHNGEVVHTAGFGVADSSGAPVTAQTPFVIGSVSKGFTALAILQLAEQGRVDLDAPVQTYLPWFTLADPQASAQITLRHLLNQNSGLGYNDSTRPMWDRPGEFTLEARLRQLSDLAPRRAPGTDFEYSNYNYMLLGAVIEAVSGQTYGAYLADHVFAPLGMATSAASPGQAPGLAAPHRWWFGFPAPVDAPYLADALPAGFLISSAEDMARYLAFQQRGDAAVLSPESLTAMHTSCLPSGGANEYCFGWVRGPFGERTALYHEGAAEGYYSVVALDPASGWGVVVLSNVNGMIAAPAKDLAIALLDHLADGTPLTVSRRFGLTYTIVDVIVLALTGLMVFSLVRLPRWKTQLAANRPRGFGGWTGKVALPILSEFILPYVAWVFLPQGAGFPMWKVFFIFQPDLVAWVFLMVGLFLLRGLLRAVLAFAALKT